MPNYYWPGYKWPVYSQPTEAGDVSMGDYPQVAWSEITKPVSQYGPRTFSGWLQNQMGSYMAQYQADQGFGRVDPGVSFYDWATSGTNFDPYKDYSHLAPYERGERPQLFGGRGRWTL